MALSTHNFPPAIRWMSKKISVGHIFWPVFLVSAPLCYHILDQAFSAYGDIPAIRHPIAFMVSLLAILVLPSFMATGYYLIWDHWRSRRTALLPSDADEEKPEAASATGKFATFSLIAGLGFIPLLLFVVLLMAFDAVGIDVQDNHTREIVAGGLFAAALAADRWSKISVNFMLGGLLLWGGLYVHWHLADDTLSRWILFDSGVF
jgi:hypothetical protein